MGTCGWCGNSDFEPGFLEDRGGGNGDVRWIQGALERGPLGGARRVGRPRFFLSAHRCLQCGHLEFFALNQSGSAIT